MTRAFARFIEARKIAGGVDRIVISECHMVLDSSVRWTLKILELVDMMDKGIQVVFLTATMRPKDEPEFSGIMGTRED